MLLWLGVGSVILGVYLLAFLALGGWNENDWQESTSRELLLYKESM